MLNFTTAHLAPMELSVLAKEKGFPQGGQALTKHYHLSETPLVHYKDGTVNGFLFNIEPENRHAVAPPLALLEEWLRGRGFFVNVDFCGSRQNGEQCHRVTIRDIDRKLLGEAHRLDEAGDVDYNFLSHKDAVRAGCLVALNLMK